MLFQIWTDALLHGVGWKGVYFILRSDSDFSVPDKQRQDGFKFVSNRWEELRHFNKGLKTRLGLSLRRLKTYFPSDQRRMRAGGGGKEGWALLGHVFCSQIRVTANGALRFF